MIFRILGVSVAAAFLAGIAWAEQPPKPAPGKPAFVWKGSTRGYLGVQVMPLTPELRSHFGVSEDRGVLVSRVEEGSPAAAAGIEVGDVLTAVDGEPVLRPAGLARAIRGKKAGESVAVDYVRDKSALSASVAVEERERPLVDLAEFEFEFPEPPLLPDVPPLPGGHGFVFAGPEGALELDEESLRAFEEAMKGLEEKFESEEWQQKLKKLRELDTGKIQERMKEVEERLRKLEAELEKESKKKP
jgi:membrane-associated protease RseP (regulator of RpoE activity)